MEPKRIVYIAAHIKPAHTGGEQYNLHLLSAAEKAGIAVVRTALSDNRVYRWLRDARVLWRLCRPFSWVWLHIKIWRYRHEALLFDVWLAPLLWPGIRLVYGHYLVMVHHLCADLCESSWRRWWQGFYEAQLLQGAVRVLTVSQSSKRQVEAAVRGKTPIDVVNTAFEPVAGLTHGGGDTLRLLYVGHITRAKGVTDLAHAVAALPKDDSWRLDLVGRNAAEPDTTERVMAICQQAGIVDRVCLHGRLDDEALLALYLSSDIFVLPSLWEGYGIVLLEAMSHRLAVVSTTAGAIPEVVHHGTTGLLVAPGDVAALHDALYSLMSNKDLRDKLAEEGLAFARKHADWGDMEDQCVQWWNRMERSHIPLLH